MNYRIVWEPDGVYVEIKGLVVFESAFQLLQQIVTNPKLQSRKYRIYNLLGSRMIEHTVDNMKTHASISKAASVTIKENGHKVAFVAEDSQKNRELFEAYSQITSGSEKLDAEFFDTMKDARMWVKY